MHEQNRTCTNFFFFFQTLPSKTIKCDDKVNQSSLSSADNSVLCSLVTECILTTLCDYFQTAQRGGEAAVRGGSRAPESAAQEGPPRLQIPAEAEEIGQERAERPGGRRADAHLPERDLQGAAAGRLSCVQPGRGAFTWRALR